MSDDFLASIEEFGIKTDLLMEAVFKGAASDTSELMTRRQASVKDTGGDYQEGFVAVDTGELINSQEASLNGSAVGEGDGAYSVMIEGMGIGDIAEHVFTAEHARPHEYGFSGTRKDGSVYFVPGRFPVRNAVQQWGTVVRANAQYVSEP